MTSLGLQIGNYVKYYNSTVSIAELRASDCVIRFADGTLLAVWYDQASPIFTESHVLVQIGCTLLNRTELPLHKKSVYKMDILGRNYFIHMIEHSDHIILRFENYFAFRYLHELQNICTLINPEFSIDLFSSSQSSSRP